MTRIQLQTLLQTLNIPPEKTEVLAIQLEKRAQQLAKKRGEPCDKTLEYLVSLLKQGWQAKQIRN